MTCAQVAKHGDTADIATRDADISCRNGDPSVGRTDCGFVQDDDRGDAAHDLAERAVPAGAGRAWQGSCDAGVRRETTAATKVLLATWAARLFVAATEKRNGGGVVVHDPTIPIDCDDCIAGVLEDRRKHRSFLVERRLEGNEPNQAGHVVRETVSYLRRTLARPGSSDGREG
jgi:hypothetical protein